MSSSVRVRWLVMSSSKALKEEVKRLYGDKVRRSPSVRPLSRDQATFKGSGHFEGIRPLVLLSSEAFIEALHGAVSSRLKGVEETPTEEQGNRSRHMRGNEMR